MPKNKHGEQLANVHLLVGYNQGNLTDFQEMAAELRKTFPQATDDQIHCGKVIRSVSVDGFTIVTWNAHLPKDKYDGWAQTNAHPEYHWV